MMPVIVLAVICLVVAALLGVVNMITEPVIEDAKIEAITESLGAVMEGGKFSDPDELPADAPKTVTAKYTDINGNGYVVTLETSGYEADSLNLTVGVDKEGKITKVILTKNAESKDTGKSNAYPEQFAGLDAAGVEGVELIAGITRSSTAIKGAVYDALVVCGFAEAQGAQEEFDNGGVTERGDEEIIAIAKELMAGDYEKASTEGMPTTVKAVFRNKTNGGYAIHIATRTEWRPLETEGVVAVSGSGVVENVKMLNWIVGAAEGTTPPECTPEFLNSIVGKHNSSLDRVDLVSRATNTSNNFLNALRAAMDVLYPAPVYSIIGICVLCAIVGGVIAFAAVRYIKRREKNEQ